MGKTIDVIKNTVSDFMDDNCTSMAAALSYYSVFSLPPLLILLLSIVGLFVDSGLAREQIVLEMEGLLGPDGGRLISTLITQANQPGTGVMAIIGAGALVLGASGAFMQLQSALNAAWEVRPDPAGRSVARFITKRLLSFGMILIIAFLLLISLVFAALVSAFSSVIRNYIGESGLIIVQILQLGVGFIIAWLLFATLFKFIPDVRIAWRDVWLGAFVTAVLFSIGRFAIGLYLGHTNTLRAFGAATALAVLFVWIYYAANIVLLGAEFTQVWAKQHGRAIEPEPGAIRVDDAVHRTSR